VAKMGGLFYTLKVRLKRKKGLVNDREKSFAY